MSKKVLINADDFGLNEHCTDAIIEAFRENLITDTTMVANGSAFEYACRCVNDFSLAGKIGVHFNLTEGTPLTEDIKKLPAFCYEGQFHDKINRLKPLSRQEKAAVYKELNAQTERIIKSGIEISHADSHHHIHTAIFITPIVLKVCKQHGIRKIRLHRNIGDMPLYKRIVKAGYNKMLAIKGFETTDYFCEPKDWRDDLQGVSEMMVHPDYLPDGTLIDITQWNDDGTIDGTSLQDTIDRKSGEMISYGEL